MKKEKYFDKDFFKYLALFNEIGFTIVINIAFAIYIYNYFEKKFFKSWKILIFMIILGIFNGFYSLYKIIFPKNKIDKKD